ncbi:MAG: AbgT family transporter [Lachnospiraceae bacterium]|nr:AbgT family transporter [Lachnospiraceae bacterium]
MAKEKNQKKEKKAFKMPHLLWIMLGLIMIASIGTYFIPAGQFAVDESGKVLGDQFAYLGYQTPVSPAGAMMLIKDGLVGSALIIFTVMIAGANISTILATGAVDDFINWAVYKMKDKSQNILISIMFCMMVYLGAFGGNDSFIAIVPIGVIFATKLGLDPIVAIGVSTYATLIGFGTGPTKCMITQMMMEVPAYSGFGMRFLIMNFFMVVGLVFLLRYCKKLKKNPESSPMWSEGWRPGAGAETGSIKEATLSLRTVIIMAMFIGQYLLFVLWPFLWGDSTSLYPFMMAVNITVAVVAGAISGMNGDEIGNNISKGLASMAFVGVVIGLARVMSLVMTNGNILHTIVYILTLPLLDLPRSVSSVGMTAIIAVLNPIIPSATSKAAILVPIIKPICEVLGLSPQLAVQAFQFGDGFTNLLSPVLGWMIGSCVTAKVPFDKWLKWIWPKVLTFTVLSFVWIFVLTAMNWA